MQLITFFNPMTVAIDRSPGKSLFTFTGNCPYLVSSHYYRNLYKEISGNIFKSSTYDNRIVQFSVGSGSKKSPVLLYNGSGGIGDQIMTWPVAKILSQLGYEVHVLADLGLELCWWHLPWVKAIRTLPITQAEFEMYKQTVIFEAVANMDEHEDQLHPVDTMLKRLGINPWSIDPEMKRAAPTFAPEEVSSAQKYLNGL